jgi:hypothetical protein
VVFHENVGAAAVAAPLLGLSATLYPQETLAKPHQLGEDIVNTVIIRGAINGNNCLGTGSGVIQGVRGTRYKVVTIRGCLDDADQTNWVFFNSTLINLTQPAPQCVHVNGDAYNRFTEGAPLVLENCDHAAVRWELAGGKFVTHDNLRLDAFNGESGAVLRKCALEAGGLRDPRCTDQYWDLVPTQ